MKVFDAFGRWVESLGAPAADFTPDQIRRIMRDVAGLRECGKTSPVGYAIEHAGMIIFVSWNHVDADRAVKDMWLNRATDALNRTGYRGHFEVINSPNGRFISIQVPHR